MDRQNLLDELRDLRETVPGVTGTLVAACDGLLVAGDTEDYVDADSLAAIAAVSLGVARRVVGVTGRGTLCQAVTHASRGHVALYAIGDVALLAVIGDEGLDISRLHQQSQPTLGRLRMILTEDSYTEEYE